MKRALSFCLAVVLAAPAYAASRDVTVEGVAPVGTDPARARRAAIGDALRQALAAGGMDVHARTYIDRNVIRSDSVWATAKGKVTGYRLTDEWREAGMVHVSVSATIAPLEAPSCSTDPLPPLHLGAAYLDIDPAVDPAIAEPLLADFDHAMRQAFGSRLPDRFMGAVVKPVALADRFSERYLALAYGHAPGSGVYVRPYLKISRRMVPGIALVRGQRLEVVAGVELIDAARGTVLGRVTRDSDRTLAARNWEYLPADYRPAKRAVAPNMQGMFGDLVEDAQQFIRCRPVTVAIASAQNGELLLEGGTEAGLRVGDLLNVGGPTVSATESPDWPLAEVVAVSDGSARARLFNPENGVIQGNVAVRLR